MSLPGIGPLDQLAVIEMIRLAALIESADRDLAERGLTRRGDARKLLQLRLQASRRLESWLAHFGMTPRSRVDLARRLAEGGLAAEIARRRGRQSETR
jgi:hypothetical protein